MEHSTQRLVHSYEAGDGERNRLRSCWQQRDAELRHCQLPHWMRVPHTGPCDGRFSDRCIRTYSTCKILFCNYIYIYISQWFWLQPCGDDPKSLLLHKSDLISKNLLCYFVRYSDWTAWSLCEPFCNGTQTRNRAIITESPDGPCLETTESQECSNLCQDCRHGCAVMHCAGWSF